MNRHPSEETLALMAGGELGRMHAWLTERHVACCPECQGTVSEFSATREEVVALAAAPQLSWNRLAAEMRANIRLGLEAGECVIERQAAQGMFTVRALVACGSLAMLLTVGFFIEQPAPHIRDAQTPEAVLESSRSGIQVIEGSQALMLLNPGSPDVQYQASGSTMGARYVNSDTGQVTINNVYVQ